MIIIHNYNNQKQESYGNLLHYHLHPFSNLLMNNEDRTTTVSVEREGSEYLEEKTRVVLCLNLMKFQSHS